MKLFCLSLLLTLPLTACGQSGSSKTPAFPSITLIKETRPNKPELLVAWYHSFQESCMRMWDAKGKPIPKSVMLPSQDILNISFSREEEYFQGDHYARYFKESKVGELDIESCKFLPPVQFEKIDLVRGCESVGIDVTRRQIEKISSCDDPFLNGLKAHVAKDGQFKFGSKEETVAGQRCGYGVSSPVDALGEICYLKSMPYYTPLNRNVVLKVDFSSSEVEKFNNRLPGGVISDHRGSTSFNTIATQVKLGELIPREKFYADEGRENYKLISEEDSTEAEAVNGSKKSAPKKQ